MLIYIIMSNRQPKVCNVTVNGEQYHDTSLQLGQRALGNVLSIGWEFIQFSYCCGCFMCMLLILGIMAAGSSSTTSLIILGIPALICCICAIYHYYNYSSAKSDLADISKSMKSTDGARPCKDSNTGVIYN
jgi:hypothetical protein